MNVLITVFFAVHLTSALFAGLLWYQYRHDLLKLIFIFWLLGIVSFITQGLLNSTDLVIFLGFSTHIGLFTVLLEIYGRGVGVKIPWRIIATALALGFVTSFALLANGASFTIGTLPMCLAFGITAIYCGLFLKSTAKSDLPTKLFRLLVALGGVHFLDYPFMRPYPDLTVIGFSIGFMFFTCYSIYVPIFIMKNISDTYASKLEALVAERTRDLVAANETLETTNLRLKQLDGENTALLNVVSHDLATPVMMMGLEAQRIEAALLPDVQKRSLLRITRATENIQKTLDHVRELHASRLGKRKNNDARVELQAVLKKLLGDFDERMRAKNLKVDLDFQCATDITVHADEERLQNQIFANLLSKAIKFSHPGGRIQFEISLENREVKIRIRDHGVGIPDYKVPLLFDSNTPTTSRGTSGEIGTGLGLPIVLHYAQLMGGHVQLVNPTARRGSDDAGTCFEVRLRKAA